MNKCIILFNNYDKEIGIIFILILHIGNWGNKKSSALPKVAWR